MSAVPIPVRGPHRAVPETPALEAGTVRRTTSIDMIRPDGIDSPMVADIRGRDLLRTDDGRLEVLDRLGLRVEIDPRTSAILSLTGRPDLGRLEGASLRRGWGTAVVDALGRDAAERTLVFSALEDLNGANLVSGYGRLREGLLAGSKAEGEARAAVQQDVCAGWARGGAVVEHLRLTGANAVPMGPVAPAITTSEDGRWHELDPLPPGSVRRLRCLDVRRAGGTGHGATVRAHFRDSYRSQVDESVMHEYVVTAAVDASTNTIGHLEVDPRVLPWDSCPAAVASAAALEGTPVDEIPRRVRAELVGPATCTHLNSTVRSLADVAALLAVPTAPGRLGRSEP